MSRVQLALNVSNLDQAIDFYSKLFATEPAKVRPGYANFAIADPPLKLVLFEAPSGSPTVNIITVLPNWFVSGVSETVRLLPLPLIDIPALATRPVFDELAAARQEPEILRSQDRLADRSRTYGMTIRFHDAGSL